MNHLIVDLSINPNYLAFSSADTSLRMILFALLRTYKVFLAV